MSIFSRFYRLARRQFLGEFDDYLRSCRGIVHVGANRGQERKRYDQLGLQVIWIEPIPGVFDELLQNLAGFLKQRAIKALLADQDDQELVLNVASNHGASSSIFDLAGHKDLWPDVHYVDRLTLKSVTLPTLIAREAIDVSLYDALLLDTQGAEYSILKGAEPVLHQFRFVQVEAADFEAYAGAASRSVITEFMIARGFKLLREQAIAKDESIGGYYDLVFERRSTSAMN